MIKRITGKIAAWGIVAVVVFTALGYGTYRSMLPEDLFGTDGSRTGTTAGNNGEADGQADTEGTPESAE